MSQRILHWTFWVCILLSGNATAQLLTKGEYFFDNDPGEGYGTLIYVNPQIPNPNITFNAPASGLAPGFHFFSMRFQDQYGNWGITGTHKIYINQPFFPFPAQVLSMPIVEAEYFWDEMVYRFTFPQEIISLLHSQLLHLLRLEIIF